MAKNNQSTQLITTGKLAEILACHTLTIQRKTKEGRIPAIKVGNKYRYNLDDVLTALTITKKGVLK